MRAAGVLLSRTMRHSYSAKLPELLEARPRTRFNDQFRVALRTARLRNVGGTERPIAEQFKFIDERLKNLHHWLCTFWQVRDQAHLRARHMQCSKNLLLDHLIGADEDCLRDGQPDGLRGLEVEDQLELRDLLH